MSCKKLIILLSDEILFYLQNKIGLRDLYKKYPTLSAPAKNNATPAKWFWRIERHNYCPRIKNFKPIVGVILFF